MRMQAKTVLGNVVGSVKLKDQTIRSRMRAITKLNLKYGPGPMIFEVINE